MGEPSWPAAFTAADHLINLTATEEDELRLLNFPSKQEDLGTAIPLTVIFALLLVTGCVGNLCTAIVIARPKNKYMHTATNYYLFSLAMSDFLFLILGLPQEMYTLWQRYPYAFGESFCIIRGYLSEASTYASILTISAFTIERYVAICHPLWAHTMSQLPRAITSIVLIWCLAAVCAIPPAAELGIITQRGPLTNRTLEQSAQCATKRTIYENMFVVSAIVFFIVPMIIVTVLYILIAIELRRSSRMNSAISKQTFSHLHSSSNGSNHHQHHHHHNRHHHNHHYHEGRRGRCALHSAHCPSSGHHLVGPRTDFGGARQSNILVASSQQHLGAPDTCVQQRPRPSSAIGNEHLQNMSTNKSGQVEQQEQQSPLLETRGPVKRGLWPPPWGSKADGWARQLHQSLSHQLASRQVSEPSTSDSTARQHSPLSYHESLIQRQCPNLGAAVGRPPSVLAQSQHQLMRSSSCQQQPPPHEHCSGPNYQAAAKRRSAAASSKKSVVRMLVAVVVSFFICWVPFHAQRLLASYLAKDENQNQFLLDIYLKLTYISGVMYYLSSTINPLLYQLMSAKFRLAFKETFNCSLLKCDIFLPKKMRNCSPTNSIKQPDHSAARRPWHPAEQSVAAQMAAELASGPLSSDGCSGCHLLAANRTSSGLEPSIWPPGVLSRLRGRLSGSLASLLRLQSSERPSGCRCCCCCANAPICNPTVSTGPKGLASCASTPLLAVGTSDNPRPSVNPATLGGRSVLKFIKSPSPLTLDGQHQQQQQLSRLSSREEEADPAEQPPSTATNEHQKAMDALIKPSASVEDDDGIDLNVQSLLTSGGSTAGSSATSSPEQAHETTTGRLAGQTRRHKLPSESSSGDDAVQRSNGRARRASFQQAVHLAALSVNSNGAKLEVERRRKSSSSSNRNLSSSLSSSERHLDKKLSMSTTTSALDDSASCVTSAGQSQPEWNPLLAQLDYDESQAGRPLQSMSCLIEDEPTSVIELRNETDSLIANELGAAHLAGQST